MSFANHQKRLLKFVAPALYALFLLKYVDLDAVMHHLANMRVDLVSLSVLLFPFLTTVLTYRWWIICRHLEMRPSFKILTEIYYASWFLGILPFVGTGGIAKIFYLKNCGEPASKAAVSIAFEKIIEIFGLLLFGVIGIVYLPKDLIGSRVLVLYWGILFLISLLAALFGRFLARSIRKGLNRYLNKQLRQIGDKLESILIDLWAGFDVKAAMVQFLLVVTINLVRALVLFLLALSLGIDVRFMQILACRALIGIINIIPITINGLGTRDALLLIILPIWGIPNESALALGVAAFLWIVLSQFVSAIFWIKLPLPLKAFDEMKRRLFVNGD